MGSSNNKLSVFVICTCHGNGKNWLKETFVKHHVVNRHNFPQKNNFFIQCHCVKSVRIRNFSGLYFPKFGLCIQSIPPYLFRMRENTDQKNSEYRYFSHSLIIHHSLKNNNIKLSNLKWVQRHTRRSGKLFLTKCCLLTRNI